MRKVIFLKCNLENVITEYERCETTTDGAYFYTVSNSCDKTLVLFLPITTKFLTVDKDFDFDKLDFSI